VSEIVDFIRAYPVDLLGWTAIGLALVVAYHLAFD
jgi:hypothetical protein